MIWFVWFCLFHLSSLHFYQCWFIPPFFPFFSLSPPFMKQTPQFVLAVYINSSSPQKCLLFLFVSLSFCVPVFLPPFFPPSYTPPPFFPSILSFFSWCWIIRSRLPRWDTLSPNHPSIHLSIIPLCPFLHRPATRTNASVLMFLKVFAYSYSLTCTAKYVHPNPDFLNYSCSL